MQGPCLNPSEIPGCLSHTGLSSGVLLLLTSPIRMTALSLDHTLGEGKNKLECLGKFPNCTLPYGLQTFENAIPSALDTLPYLRSQPELHFP